MQLINESLSKILPNRVGPSTNAHVHAVRRLARPAQRFVNASSNEMERRIAFHLDGRTRVMSQDENGPVVRWVVTPPALPVRIGPRTANRSEHVPPQNPRSDVPESPRGKIVIDPGRAIARTMGLLKRACWDKPLVKVLPAHPEPIVDVLI